MLPSFVLPLSMVVALAPGPFPQPHLLTGSGVRLRAQPSRQAAELVRLPLAHEVTALEQQDAEGMTWLRVRSSDPAHEGWVAASLARPLPAGAGWPVRMAVMREKAAAPTDSPEDAQDRVEAAARLLALGVPDGDRAELTWLRLVMLRRVVELRRDESQDDAWFKRHAPEATYYDGSGDTQWMLDAEVYWPLVDALPVALREPAAWLAVTADVNEDCEYHERCMLTEVRRTSLPYLTRFPRGPHAAKAAEFMLARIRSAQREAGDKDDWGELREPAADMARQLRGVPGKDVRESVQRLKRIAKPPQRTKAR